MWFALAVQLFSMAWVMNFKKKFRTPWPPEGEPKVQAPFSRKGTVWNIGHHFWVPALNLQDEKCCLSHLALYAGIKIHCLLRTPWVAASLAGSLVTLQPASKLKRVNLVLIHAYTLGSHFGLAPHLAISPSGQIFVSDERKQRLFCFHNGTAQMAKTDVGPLYCSANGVLYMLTKNGKRVEKVQDSRLETVVASESLPADMQFQAYDLFVTKEEVIYLVDNLNENRILRIDSADSLEPTVVGRMRAEDQAFLSNLFVTEAGIIFVSDLESRKVFALHPGSPTFTEVWKCPGGLYPRGLLVHDRSLYVSMDKPDGKSFVGKVYEIMLPPDVLPKLGWRARWRSRKLNLSWLAKKYFKPLFAAPNIPSGKQPHNYGKSPFCSWVNQLFQWPFSSSLFVCLPGRVIVSKSPKEHGLTIPEGTGYSYSNFWPQGQIWSG